MSTALRALCGTLLCSLVATGAEAQSLLSARGLGLPFLPTDGRSVALGGVGVGLIGAELSVVDPAASARLLVPSVAFSFQSSWADYEDGSASGDFTATRFPYIALGYPSSFGTVSISLGGYLDQRWTATDTRTIDLDGAGGTGIVTDNFRSDGGISTVRLGLARSITPDLDIGVQVGRHIGDVSRVFTRSFDSLDVGGVVQPYQSGGRWSYRGWLASIGASADVGSILRLAAAWTWAGDLDALPDEDTVGGAEVFPLPSELRVGATAVLSPLLRASFGVHHSGWSSADEALEDEGARNTFAWGGGVEWAGASVLGKASRLRVGYRNSPLPFTLEGGDDPTESAFTAGLGMDLLVVQGVVLSRLDLTLERGLREAGSFQENFWRLATSVRLSGF